MIDGMAQRLMISNRLVMEDPKMILMEPWIEIENEIRIDQIEIENVRGREKEKEIGIVKDKQTRGCFSRNGFD
jgi:hypothetical protein